MANTFNHNDKVVINGSGQMSVNSTSFAYVDDKLYVSGGNIILDNNRSYLQYTTGGSRASIISLNSSNNLNVGQSNVNNGSLNLYGGTGNVTINAGASEVARFTTSGNVGIGTTSPAEDLHIGNNNPVIQIGTSNSTTGNAKLSFFSGNNGTFNGYFIQYTKDTGVDRLDFIDGGGTAKISFVNGGNVGIGTSSPAYGLTVQNNNTINTEFRNTAGDALAIKIGTGLITFLSTYEVTGTNMDIAFTPTKSNGTQTEALRIQASSGNVGIGTTSPSYKLHVSGTSYFSSTINVDEVDSIAYSPNSNYNLPLSSGTNIINNVPFARAWHDLLSFQFSRLTQESYDGTSWSSDTLEKNVFIGKEDVSIGVITTNTGVRWTLSGTAYNYGKWLQICFTYTSPSPTVQVTVESSSDNTNWTTRHSSSDANSGNSRYYRVDDFGGHDYVRISLERTSGSSNVNVSSIKFLSARAGDQGNGVEYEFPYSWDANKTITAGAFRGTSSEINYFTGNVGIGTTSPVAQLDITKTFNARAGAQSNPTGGASVAIDYQTSSDIQGRIRSRDWDAAAWKNFTIEANNILLSPAGNVGIGTTSPAYRLDVSGASQHVARFTSTTADNGGLIINKSNASYNPNILLQAGGSTKWYILSDSSDSDKFKLYESTGTSPRFTLTQGGNVGIGTTSPGDKLEIVGGTLIIPNGQFYRGRYNGGTPQNLIGMSTGNVIQVGDFSSSWNVQIGGTSAIQFMIQNSEKVRIDGSGNVGIGTTAPKTILDVRPAGITGLTMPTFGTAAYGGIHIVPSGSATTEAWYGITFGNTSSTSSEREGSTAGIYTSASGTYGNKLYFATSNNWATGAVSRMMIDPTGNVGIGTTSPTSKLHVASGNIEIDNGYYLRSRTSGGSNLFNLIGMASDSIVVGGWEGNWMGNLHLRGGNGYVVADFSQGNSSYFAVRGVSGSTPSEYMRVASSGNVGIGTTSPNEKLVIQGNGARIKIQTAGDPSVYYTFLESNYNAGNTFNIVDGGSYKFGSKALVTYNDTYVNSYYNVYIATGTADNSNVSNIRLFVAQGGNVGIGTTSPIHKLYVNGDIGLSDGYRIWLRGSSSSSATGAQSYIYSDGLNLKIKGDDNVQLLGDGGGVILHADYTGNVGIGTTSPDSKFHVEDTSPEVRITGTGGTSFPRLLWEYPVSATQASRWALTASASGNTFYLYNYTQSKKIFQVDGTASHITLNHDAAGTTQIGTSTTQTAYQLYVKTNVGQTGAIEASGAVKITSGALGVNIAASATAGRIDASNDIVAYSTSDSRLKENIKPLENATEKVKKLTGVEFDWKQEHKAVHGYEGHDVGVIAQEVQEVLPEAIRTNDSGYLSVRYEKLIGLLIESNKELAARVEELEQKLKQ